VCIVTPGALKWIYLADFCTITSHNFNFLSQHATDHMDNGKLKKDPVEGQKKLNISEKLGADLQGWREHDTAPHFQILIHEMQRGWKKIMKQTRSGRSSGWRVGNVGVRTKFQ
jgi:hypothetical protein